MRLSGGRRVQVSTVTAHIAFVPEFDFQLQVRACIQGSSCFAKFDEDVAADKSRGVA